MNEMIRRRRILLWIVYWVLLFTLTHIPAPGLGAPAVPHLDKVVHAALYFLLTLLGGRAILGQRAPFVHVLAWAMVYAVFAGLDEWSQQFVGRTPSLGDWFADLLGIAVASIWLLYRPGITQTP